MYVIAVCSAAFVCEQFAVAKKGIEKQNDAGDAEALANVDEAVVLEGDGVRDSTAAPPRSPLTSPRLCVCVCVRDSTAAPPRSPLTSPRVCVCVCVRASTGAPPRPPLISPRVWVCV